MLSRLNCPLPLLSFINNLLLLSVDGVLQLLSLPSPPLFRSNLLLPMLVGVFHSHLHLQLRLLSKAEVVLPVVELLGKFSIVINTRLTISQICSAFLVCSSLRK